MHGPFDIDQKPPFWEDFESGNSFQVLGLSVESSTLPISLMSALVIHNCIVDFSNYLISSLQLVDLPLKSWDFTCPIEETCPLLPN